LQPMGTLLHSCVEVCELIELSFGVMSGKCYCYVYLVQVRVLCDDSASR